MLVVGNEWGVKPLKAIHIYIFLLNGKLKVEVSLGGVRLNLALPNYSYDSYVCIVNCP